MTFRTKVNPYCIQVTAYYLWLPFLLTFCFGFAKFPRSVWRNFLENGLVSFYILTLFVCFPDGALFAFVVAS